MQVAYDHRHLANISCNLWETFVPLRTISCNLRETFVPLHTISCNLRETFVPLQTSPATCGRLSYPYKHLLQLAGDLRTPTNISCNLRETIVPLHTISCNLRETIVPLQTSPAICGRPSYPYKHLLQSAGDLRTPTKKCFSIFFRLRFVLLIESPTFVSLKYNTQKR